MYPCPTMEIVELQSLLRRHRNVVVFAALIMLAAGLDLLLSPPAVEGIEILSLPLLVTAIFLLAAIFWPIKGKIELLKEEPTLAQRLLNRLSLRGQLVPYFPLIGIIIISLDVIYNFIFASTSTLQIHDTVTILFGLSLVVYPFVPQRFGRERDFVMLFFLVLILILVLPLLILRIVQGDFEKSVDAYSWTLLAPELQAILGLLGIQSNLFSPPLGTAPGLTFMTQQGQEISVVISTSCSGIYSFSIFASAFVAFVLTEFKKTNWRVWVLLGLGFLASYFANLLRMTVIVVTGYLSNTTQDALNSMLIAHSNAGWLIFLGWITLFWLLMYRFIFPKKDMEKEQTTPVKTTMSLCEICGEPLSPTIPGTKCECGNLYHTSCLRDKGQCPECQKSFAIKEEKGKTYA